MPWTAIPYENQNAIGALGSKYGVRGIPSFIVLNADGSTQDKDGRTTVGNSKGNLDAAKAVWK
jgi:hypothetical protein